MFIRIIFPKPLAEAGTISEDQSWRIWSELPYLVNYWVFEFYLGAVIGF